MSYEPRSARARTRQARIVHREYGYFSEYAARRFPACHWCGLRFAPGCLADEPTCNECLAATRAERMKAFVEMQQRRRR